MLWLFFCVLLFCEHIYFIKKIEKQFKDKICIYFRKNGYENGNFGYENGNFGYENGNFGYKNGNFGYENGNVPKYGQIFRMRKL